MPHDLVAELSRVPPHGTLRLEPGEHRVNLVLDRPITVQGCGPATHLQGARGTGPTIHVRSRGVVLEDLGVEHLDPTSFAVLADPGTDPVCTNLAVAGGQTAGCTQRIRTTPALGPGSRRRSRPTTSRTTGPPPVPSPPLSPPIARAPAPIVVPGPMYLPAPLPSHRAVSPPAATTPGSNLAVVGGIAAIAILGVVAMIARGQRSPAKAATPVTGGEVPDPRRGGSGDHQPPPPPVPPPPAPAPPPPPPPPPPPAAVEFVGWDPASQAGVVDTRYVEDDGDALTLRLVFDPRNGVVERLGGPAPRATFRVDRSGELDDLRLQALWTDARPAGEYSLTPRRPAPDLRAPGGAVTVALDAEAKLTDGRMVPAEVVPISGGYRVIWRRWSEKAPPDVTIGGAIRSSTRNVVTYNAVDRDGRTWDLLQLEARVPGTTTFSVLNQDVQFYWLGARVLITVNESTDEVRGRSGNYFVRNVGPQIKVLYPLGAREHGEEVAVRLEQRLHLIATTLEENPGNVRPGVFYRRHIDPQTRQVTPGDADNARAARAIRALLDLPAPEIESLRWIDILVVLAPP